MLVRRESFYEAILRDAQLSHLMSRIGTLSGVPSLTFPTQEDDDEDESTHDRGRSSRSGHRGLESRRGDSDCFWSVALSPGEKQRLAFARLFYHKPDLAGEILFATHAQTTDTHHKHTHTTQRHTPRKDTHHTKTRTTKTHTITHSHTIWINSD